MCDEVVTRGPWLTSDLSRHINQLELLAAFHALRSFAARAVNISIHFFLDNSTAVSYINKCGGTRSRRLCVLAQQFCSFCESRNIYVTASHLPGAFNTIADIQSRIARDSSDWLLDGEVFHRLSLVWPVDTDLFASAWNAQLTRFAAWSPQPGALATNAFSLSWGELEGYAFPSFALIDRCLSKVTRDQATITLVCPLWPAQHWFPPGAGNGMRRSDNFTSILSPINIRQRRDSSHAGEWPDSNRLAVVRGRLAMQGFSGAKTFPCLGFLLLFSMVLFRSFRLSLFQLCCSTRSRPPLYSFFPCLFPLY